MRYRPGVKPQPGFSVIQDIHLQRRLFVLFTIPKQSHMGPFSITKWLQILRQTELTSVFRPIALEAGNWPDEGLRDGEPRHLEMSWCEKSTLRVTNGRDEAPVEAATP